MPENVAFDPVERAFCVGSTRKFISIRVKSHPLQQSSLTKSLTKYIVWCTETLYNLLSYKVKQMYITIDADDRRPIYQQVVDEIKSLIAKGELREGTVLPPVRQLAADLGVNLNTIATAYRELQNEGLVIIKHGSGAVVTSRRSSVSGEDELRKPLRAALTQLVLAGLPRAQIMSIVADELRGLLKGAK